MKSESSPAVSVCILAFNRRDEALRTIAILEDPAQGNPALEIIVADNGSKDGTAEAIRTQHPSVRLIELPENIGIAALNQAFEAATAPLTFILDDDSHPEPGTIARCVETMRQRPDVGAIACKIIYETTGEPWINPILPDHEGEPIEVMSFIGCGACVRTEALCGVGGYADFYFLYENEIEIGLRLWNAGHRVIYDPSAPCIHRVAPSHRTSVRHIHLGLRNNLWTVSMYAGSHRRLSMTTGLLLFFGKWALREHMLGPWFRAVRESFGRRRERRARRLAIRPETWEHFRPYTEKYGLAPMIRRHLFGGR